mmetsp:Transcript_17017/g.54258  ORF Transcript_17017/g.54258 Transcript_17017/m.54258 type:complete len:232 (-) Transcript_17017:5870-6565(-)
MRSPLGRVSRRLSSSTELRDSIHSGSTSPSQMIQLCVVVGSLTTCRAAAVSTPSNHSRVSGSMCPRSCLRGMALGFMTCTTGAPLNGYRSELRTLLYAPSRMRHSTDLPEPEGPTMMTPMRCVHAMCSCSTFSTCRGTCASPISFTTSLIASSISASARSDMLTLGKTSRTRSSKRRASSKVSLGLVVTRRERMMSSTSAAGVSTTPSAMERCRRSPAIPSTVLSARRPQS